MLLEIDHHSGIPIYRQIIDQVRRQIMAGQLGEGQQLDSVRELAGRLRVNPMTISKAYTLLEVEGLVERRRGVGLFVARVQDREKEKARTVLLEEILKKAAIMAVQFEVPEEEASHMFLDLYRKYEARTRSYSNE
jgi:GntR family transcriptional regulator